MEHLGDLGSPNSPALGGEEGIDLSKPRHWISLGDGNFWLPVGAVWFYGDPASGNQGIRTTGIFTLDGEAWAVDGKSSDKFKVAVHSSPVPGQWGPTQRCSGGLVHGIGQCARYPHAEAVLTCVDHCHDGSCVVVVFYGWDEAEGLIGMSRAKGDLANPNRTTI